MTTAGRQEPKQHPKGGARTPCTNPLAPHLHLPLLPPAHADGDAVHGDQQLLGERLRPPVILLHPHREGHQLHLGPRSFGRRQRVGAGAGKTQRAPVEGAERRGAQHLAAPAAAGVAAPHPVLHRARLSLAAARLSALQFSIPFAGAALGAAGAGEEVLAPLVVAAVVQAAAAGQGDAAVAALQEAGVAEAALGARGRLVTAFVLRLAAARGRAGRAAELVVLVRGADGA